MTDIILEEGVEEEDVDFITDTPTYGELIAAAYQTLDAFSGMDEKLLSKSMESKIKQARVKAIDIIIHCIDKLHEQI